MPTAYASPRVLQVKWTTHRYCAGSRRVARPTDTVRDSSALSDLVGWCTSQTPVRTNPNKACSNPSPFPNTSCFRRRDPKTFKQNEIEI